MTSTVKIPEGWIETTLSEIAEIIMGQSPKGESYNLNGDGLPFYQGVTEFSEKYVGLKTYTTQPTKVIGPGTILFSVRAPVGKVNFTKWEACIGRGNAGIIMKNGNQEYLFYLLKYIETQILKSASGTVFDSISGKELQKISVTIPKNPQDQKAIAGVLSAFDDKIELLRAENQTLEEMGQTLFKERFGKYKVGDELPDGWKVGKLGDYCETVLGGTPSREKNEYWGGNIPWINSGKVNENRIVEASEYITEEGLSKSATKLMPKGTVLIAITGATLGQYSILCIDSCFNQSVVGIRESEKFKKEFLYYFIGATIKDLINNQTGGAQQHINKQVVDNHNMIIPTDEILEKYYEISEPIFNKITENLFQIESLSKARDQLLPKLMSGEVRVEF